MKSRYNLVILLIAFAVSVLSMQASFLDLEGFWQFYKEQKDECEKAKNEYERARMVRLQQSERLSDAFCSASISDEVYREKKARLDRLNKKEAEVEAELDSRLAMLESAKKLGDQATSSRSRLQASQQAGNTITEDNPYLIDMLDALINLDDVVGGRKIVTIHVIRNIYEQFGLVCPDDFFEKREQRLSDERKRRAQQAAQQAAQEYAAKSNAILLGHEKVRNETAGWNALTSNATTKNPFVNSIGIRFVRVTGADFLVSISPVSKSAMAKSNGLTKADSGPAINTWREGNDFCTWLSYAENKNYHLPSEKEWKAVVQSGILEGKGESWAWSSDVASGGEAFWADGNGKGLRGNSVRILDRAQSYNDVVTHCILAPKM